MRIIAEARLISVSANRLEFEVRESLHLDGGQEFLLAEDRGWTASGEGAWELSLHSVMRGLENAILPDDAEETGEALTWWHYQQSLRDRHGRDMPLQELREAQVILRISVDPETLRRLDEE